MAETVATLLGGFLIVALVRILGRLVPSLYFTLAQLLYGMERRLSLGAILLRFAIPALIGFLVGLWLSENQSPVGASAGFLGAVFLVAPIFLYPELMAPPLAMRRNELYIVYAMFVLSFAFLGSLGSQVGSIIRQPVMALLIRGVEGGMYNLFLEAIRSNLASLITSFLGGLLSMFAYERLFRKAQRPR